MSEQEPYPGEEVVKRGTFLYDGEVVCDLRIVYSPIRSGSGDHEDPPDLCEDQEIDSFYIHFGSTTERGRFSAGSGPWGSLAEAMEAAAVKLQGVTWLD